MSGVKTATGYRYPAGYRGLEQIDLSRGDLVTVFDRETGNDITTGDVILLDAQLVTVAPASPHEDPISFCPETRGFQVVPG